MGTDTGDEPGTGDTPKGIWTMDLHGLRHILQQVADHEGVNVTAADLNALTVIVAAASQMRRGGALAGESVDSLLAYLDGTMPEAQRGAFEARLTHEPAAQVDLDVLRRILEEEVPEKAESQASSAIGWRIWDTVMRRIDEDEPAPAQTIPFPHAASLSEWLGMAASWLGPILLALEGSRQLLFVSQPAGPVFMDGAARLEDLPTFDWQAGTLTVRVVRPADADVPASEVWLLDDRGEIAWRVEIDDTGCARFEDLPAGSYRINTDRGLETLLGGVGD